MRLMYVFDARQAEGYAMRVPKLLARMVTRSRYGRRRFWDYAPTPEGY